MKIKFEFEGNELKEVLAVASLLSQIKTQDEDENEIPQSAPMTTGTAPAPVPVVTEQTNTNAMPPVNSMAVAAPSTNTITAPTQAPATVPVTSVPTTTPTYTAEQLGVAGANLINADPTAMQKLQALMGGFGITKIDDLPPERYGDFATAMRGLGAKI